jgi:hypothetical protein
VSEAGGPRHARFSRDGVEEREPAAEILSEANGSRKSLFRNILHISPLNSKILREFLANSMIPKDRKKKNFRN